MLSCISYRPTTSHSCPGFSRATLGATRRMSRATFPGQRIWGKPCLDRCRNPQGQAERSRPSKLYDGRGLYLEITLKGARRWRFRYRRPGTGKVKPSLSGHLSRGEPEGSPQAARSSSRTDWPKAPTPATPGKWRSRLLGGLPRVSSTPGGDAGTPGGDAGMGRLPGAAQGERRSGGESRRRDRDNRSTQRLGSLPKSRTTSPGLVQAFFCCGGVRGGALSYRDYAICLLVQIAAGIRSERIVCWS